VLRHHHHPDSVAERIDGLMAGVFVADDRVRIERLSEHLAPGFVYISPGAVVDGADGLSDAFSHYRHDSWLHASLRRTSAVDVHHGHFRYSWERTEGGKVAMEGWSFGWLDAQGKIARIVSFDGLVPGTRRSPHS
jgi:hypothetical protein